ncbi:aspartyl/asparaginyl beta-hydroxylase domain-containing protein [Mesorhizobium sp. M8A.F.Ca.ET.021.01.1.1]|nr:aspartyl/asparaginyl beta-hydroxylase domain-containing protein [Mesorhizobium sp. M8A.F.Ca.ET.021.01.1.1]
MSQEILDSLPYVHDLIADWRSIRDEMNLVSAREYGPATATYLYRPGGWQVANLCTFYAWNGSLREVCPITTKLVSAFPGVVNAKFSRMNPRTRVQPHSGVQAYAYPVSRLHLGLRVPPNCGICVGDQTFHWSEGECFIFDDSVEHYAWNLSDEVRSILIVDFKAPYFDS